MQERDWLPNLFIAGVPKAGTSSLHRWIADHSDAIGARDKEACFFVDPESHIYNPEANWRTGLATYRAQFAFPEGPHPRVILDSTPAYIYQRTALAEIPDLPSAPRCLFVLRDPAEQIRSVYLYYRNNWPIIPASVSFSDYVRALRAGRADFGDNELVRDALTNARYAPWLRAWRDRLGAERMFVCSFDRLRAEPAALTREVATWAGLDPAFYDGYAFAVENESYAPVSRGLHRLGTSVRERLPGGRTYDLLRSLYRRLNTRRPTRDPEDAATLASLRAEFATANAELAQAFDLDLSGWALEAQDASTSP